MNLDPAKREHGDEPIIVSINIYTYVFICIYIEIIKLKEFELLLLGYCVQSYTSYTYVCIYRLIVKYKEQL